MTNWIVFFAGVVAVFCVWQWSLYKYGEIKYKWESHEIFILFLFFIGSMFDVFQTHFAINVVNSAIEINPVYGHNPDVFLIFLFKILTLVFLMACCRYFKVNARKFIREKAYFYFVLTVCLYQWFVVFCNEYQLFIAIEYIVNQRGF